MYKFDINIVLLQIRDTKITKEIQINIVGIQKGLMSLVFDK